ncbi:threonine/homoserine/homoserine lactone efflux protein [Actinocorallia herbida]|uniref:Threonine/homoserine/homoserine lactone efflux protein n=1 Tax=Actinocorallia herbida TaxID=58109 RepID=A0A3N1D3T4_9ACTN|nr:LysE family translocator [Actinocorallia herbida]ROO88192.1 threonine/homoserine/homoserine lactone efflux protein [Actinocorallia herbida]
MVDFGAVLGIALVALGMVLTPGPNMVYLVSRSVAQGRRAGLISLAGVACAFGLYAVAVTAGLMAVFALVPVLYVALKLAGAAYLGWLAWQALRPGGRSLFAPRELAPDRPRRLFTMGFVTSLLNPKIAILYVSLLPQFVEPERGDVALQSLLLALVQIVVAVFFNGLFVLIAGSLSAFLSARPFWLTIQRRVTGSVLAAFAVRMATDRAPAPV